MGYNNTRKAPRAEKRPTWTHLTVKALGDADDFQTAPQLQAATGANYNQISATLVHLKKFEVVGCMESEGQLWWFLTGEDKRLQVTEERTPEAPGSRSRRKRSALSLVQSEAAP